MVRRLVISVPKVKKYVGNILFGKNSSQLATLSESFIRATFEEILFEVSNAEKITMTKINWCTVKSIQTAKNPLTERVSEVTPLGLEPKTN